MASSHLETYLHDHFAGAQAAVEIMDHIEASHGNTRAGSIIKQIRPEILADRDELKGLIEHVSGSESAPRKAFGWIAEKIVELKLKVDDPSDGALRLLESVELLSLGIEGKLALWRALDASKAATPELTKLNYARLIERGEAQRNMVEDVRTEVATAAFANRS